MPIRTDLSSFSNPDYKPGSKLKRVLWYLVGKAFINSYFLPLSSWKRFWLKAFGAKIGKGVVIKPKVNIKYPWFLEVGDYSWIGENVWIDNLSQVTIGKNVCISQGALILCGNHNYKKSTFDLMVKPIHIEDGVWICAQSTVVQGVRCGSHSILGVGAVALENLEPYTIYSGNPAQKLRKREISE
jgi:putative colanic acid biosynthesis acetyltransferase WcaF